jgi:immune inhibitor A
MAALVVAGACVSAGDAGAVAPFGTGAGRSPFAEAVREAAGRGLDAPARRAVPRTGDTHLLVILAEFSDTPHRIEPARFDRLLFAADTVSMRTYYDEVSRGAFQLTGDLHGWVTLPRTKQYYSQGVGGVGSYPTNGQRMAEDALTEAIDGGLDLSAYDADTDGFVDALLVIHSGQGYEWASNAQVTPEHDTDAINSHKWALRRTDYGAGLPEVEDYFTCPELQLARKIHYPAWDDSIATIGVYCHEFGHMLGLPDFYDTFTFENRIGHWDLMDYGSWCGLLLPGDLPSHYSAWSRMFLGWTTEETLPPPTGDTLGETLTLAPVTAEGVPLRLLSNPGGVDWSMGSPGDGEFFLAEVRRREGFDAALPADGLILFHADESREGNRTDENPDGGGLLLLLPQDEVVSVMPGNAAADPWPSTGGQNAFDSTSTPSSRLFDGTDSGVELREITQPDAEGRVFFFAAAPLDKTMIPPIPFARPNPFRPGSEETVQLVVSLVPDATGEDASVTIHDLSGRRLRTLRVSAGDFAGDRRVARWDGRDDDGRPLPSGVYFFGVAGGAGDGGAGKILLLR